MKNGGRRKDLKKVYSKAFLIHLDRGDVDTARVFAKAFLLTKPNAENNHYR